MHILHIVHIEHNTYVNCACSILTSRPRHFRMKFSFDTLNIIDMYCVIYAYCVEFAFCTHCAYCVEFGYCTHCAYCAYSILTSSSHHSWMHYTFQSGILFILCILCELLCRFSILYIAHIEHDMHIILIPF